MTVLGKRIKDARLDRGVSIRKLAKDADISAPFLADIEAGRRRPGPDVLERLAVAVGLSLEELEAADSRLSVEVRQWISEHSEVSHLLDALMRTPDPDTLIRRLRGIVESASQGAPMPTAVTWESEILAIAAEASSWDIETGGDLFGWTDGTPVIYLATNAGPAAVRNTSHFRLDVEYLRQLSELLAREFGLQYFGDWHSHHTLGLPSPSGGDRKRIHNVASKNKFPAMLEIICELDRKRSPSVVRLNPWLYSFDDGVTRSEYDDPTELVLLVAPGMSPVREALINRSFLPEQELSSWGDATLENVRVGKSVLPPTLSAPREPHLDLKQRLCVQARTILQEQATAEIEFYTTAFGWILAIPVELDRFIAFAISRDWPLSVLSIQAIDRQAKTTEEVELTAELSVMDPLGMLKVFKDIVSKRAPIREGVNASD